MSEKKEDTKWRVGAYVTEETYQKLIDYQLKRKKETGRKLSQGQVLDEIFSSLEEN